MQRRRLCETDVLLFQGKIKAANVQGDNASLRDSCKKIVAEDTNIKVQALS